MIVDIDVHLHYSISKPTDLLLQIEAAGQLDQSVLSENLDIQSTDHLVRVAADEAIGSRIWLKTAQDLVCTYKASVDVQRTHQSTWAY